MNKKYELTKEKLEWQGRILYRIKALRDFANVKSGDLGGFIENEYNLSHGGNCWVYDNARVFGKVEVFGEGIMCGNVSVCGVCC